MVTRRIWGLLTVMLIHPEMELIVPFRSLDKVLICLEMAQPQALMVDVVSNLAICLATHKRGV